jgi:hypothetical protein
MGTREHNGESRNHSWRCRRIGVWAYRRTLRLRDTLPLSNLQNLLHENLRRKTTFSPIVNEQSRILSARCAALAKPFHFALRIPALSCLLILQMLVVANMICAKAPVASQPSPPQPIPEEMVVRLQVFLDQNSFGPGEIDGHWGEFCTKALQRYQMANRQQPTGQIDAEMLKKLEQISPLYITYQLTENDFKSVGHAPHKPSEAARVKAMPYRSITEFVAERYHSNENFIKKLNPDHHMKALSRNYSKFGAFSRGASRLRRRG